MKTNFEIEDNYAVRWNNIHIDLHNCFCFAGMTDNTVDKEIRLEWEKSDGDWVSDDEFDSLTFILKNSTYKYFRVGDNESNESDKKCLSEKPFSHQKCAKRTTA